MEPQILCAVILVLMSAVFCVPVQNSIQMMRLARDGNSTRRHTKGGTLDSIGGGNLLRSLNDLSSRPMMRLAREDQSSHQDNKGDKPEPQHTLDSIGGGNLIKSLNDPYSARQALRARGHAPQDDEVLRMLNAAIGRDLLSSMDSTYGSPRRAHPHPKRMLDSVSGWAFGESKRNFDEIDNVGFDNFAKRFDPYWGGKLGRSDTLALAKKNFDEIDRTGFDTYSKRNFDEIDRTGFENYQKRSVKK